MAVNVRTCDKKLKIAKLKVTEIVNKINNSKLSASYISRLNVPMCAGNNVFNAMWCKCYMLLFVCMIAFYSAYFIYSQYLTSKSCLLELPSSVKQLFRPAEDCSMCSEVTGVVRLGNTSAREFEELYAYGTTPVIVTDATDGWKAIKEFNFQFFAELYRNGKMGKQINDCFYFAYKSGLNSLQEVFNMNEARSNLSGDPWYVGWSTCYDEEINVLRSYYSRPYFLPINSESDMIDWIFMGGPGQGAHMHVDSVRHMSWQAQIRGHKQWQLAPPPECLYTCRWIQFTVAPTEILVVDTNRWYHRTNVLPGDISITIGAEYD